MLRHKLITAVTKVEDADDGLVRAIVSTEAVDRDGDIIRQSGWDLDSFQKHPLLLSSHNYGRLTNQIGKWESMEVRGTQLEGVARYFIGLGNEEADWGFQLATLGQAAYSVGFIPDMDKAKRLGDEKGWEFKGQVLLEASQVTVPSNPEGLQAVKSLDLDPVVADLVSQALEATGQTDTIDLLAEMEERLRGDFRELILSTIDDKMPTPDGVPTDDPYLALKRTLEALRNGH